MPDRLRVSSDGTDAVVTLTGADVVLVGQSQPIAVAAIGDGRYEARTSDHAWNGVAADAGDKVWVSIDGEVFAFTVGVAALRVVGADTAALMAPMPATVVRIAAAPGQAVRQGELLIALEAMKMELPIRAPHDGVIRDVGCREGELVQPGTPLITFEERT